MPALAEAWIAREDVAAVSPPRPAARWMDASQFSVPILIVIAMVVSSFTAAVSASGVYWMLRMSNQEAQYQMQADIRSIREGMAAQVKIDEANQRVSAAERAMESQSNETTKQAVDSLRGVVQLLQLQVSELVKQRK
jgi:hypothetical protein